MSIKYSFKDALTEAGARDYRDIVSDSSWDPSEELKQNIAKLAESKDPFFRRVFSTGLGKAVSVAAAVALLFGAAMAIKPVREPLTAFIGRLFSAPAQTDTQTDTEYTGSGKAVIPSVTETDKETKTTPDNTEEDTEEPFKTPQTDEEWIDYLVGTMARKGYTKEKWEMLTGYGETAVKRLVPRYFEKNATDREASVISAFIAEYIKDEITDHEILGRYFTRFKYIDIRDADLDDESVSGWLRQVMLDLVEQYAVTVNESFVKETIPAIYDVLSAKGFDGYLFDPYSVSLAECFDKYIELRENNSSGADAVWGRLFSGKERQAAFDHAIQRYQTEKDEKRRALMSCIFYMNAFNEINELINDAKGSVTITVPEKLRGFNFDRNVNIFKNADAAAPFLSNYTAEAAKYAASLYKAECGIKYPYTYAVLDAVKFDGYKPGEPDIAMYSIPALNALNELFNACRYALKIEGLSDKCKTEGEGEHIVCKYGLSDFYGYFDKYLERDVTDRILLYSDADVIENGFIFFREYGDGDSDVILPKTARLLTQNKDRAEIAVSVRLLAGMYLLPAELNVSVTAGADGVRITGGELTDKLFTFARECHPVRILIMNYMLLRECRFEYFNKYGKFAEPYADLPDDLKAIAKPDDKGSVYIAEHISGGLGGIASSEIIDGLYGRKTETYDGTFLYPDRRPDRVRPAFEYSGSLIDTNGEDIKETEIDIVDIIKAMKIIEVSKDKAVISLDFSVDGKVGAYTFVTERISERTVVTGGTFVTDVIFGE